nr:hypothetical protein [Melioribacteraceae bacterium]
MNNIEKKVEFWQELWENLINNFLKKSYGLVIYNPHILIDDIISEIEENDFRNQDNRNYFRSKINYYLKNDTIIQEKLKSQFKILVK